MPMSPQEDNIGVAGIVTGYRWCAVFVVVTGFTGSACRLGGATVVPWMLLNGTVAAKVGKLCARTWVAASKPDASLISVGSLNAVPKKLIPRGTPKAMPAGTCTIGYPGAAARPEVPKMK